MRTAKRLAWQEFITQFDKKVHGAIAANRKKEGVDGIVALQCEVLDSSRCGQLSALVYGLSCTFKSVQQMLDQTGGVYVTGLPSSAAFPINYTDDIPQ